MNKNSKRLSAALAMILLLPALVCAAEGKITALQQRAGENFIKALMINDYKAAYNLFSPAVKSNYPFRIFYDIQKNVQNSIGTPVSFSVNKKPSPAGQGSPPGCRYDLVYTKGENRTAIPLELTFDPDDRKGGLASFNYLKEQIKPAKK